MRILSSVSRQLAGDEAKYGIRYEALPVSDEHHRPRAPA